MGHILVARHESPFVIEGSLKPNCAPEKSWQTCSLAQFWVRRMHLLFYIP